MKKLFSVLILLLLLFNIYSFSYPASAEENKTESSSSQTEDKETKDSDKKGNEDKESNEPPVYSPTAKYMTITDLDSGMVIFDDGGDKEFKPGSLVKILTAITAIENASNLSKKITVKEGILEEFDYTDGNIGLKYNEEISIRELICAMMIYDAGDCALALAHSIGKSYDEFVSMMNETASKAGAKNSIFINPAGFDAKGQKTTLFDMGLIAQYALKNIEFREIIETERLEIAPTNKYTQPRILFNTNQFMSVYYSPDNYNEYITAVKGYYNSSDDCGMLAIYKDSQNNMLIGCAESEFENGINMSYKDVRHLISYGATNFTRKTLLELDEIVSEVTIPNSSDTDRLLLISDTKITAKLPNDYDTEKLERKTQTNPKILAPIDKGEVLGKTEVFYDGVKCGEANLIAYADVKLSIWKHIGYLLGIVFHSAIFKILLTVVIVVFVIRGIQINKKSKKKKS